MDTNLDFILNHLGEDRTSYHNAVSPPIYQTSNFAFPTLDALQKAFHNELDSHLYSRGNNPTVAILRKKIAALEKTEDCLVFSSGIASIAAGILSSVQSGDHVICVAGSYGWTKHLLQNYLPRFKVETTFVDGTSFEAIQEAKRDSTRLLVLESPNTMTFECQDLRACGEWCRDNSITSLIDNSYASPLLQNPSEFGIDLIAHSGSKYLNGHSDVVFGALCGSRERIQRIFDEEYMTLGQIMSPYEASLAIRGMRTLPLRIERTVKTTKEIIPFLLDHPKIGKVFHPSLFEGQQRDLANRQMKAFPGLLSITLKTENREKIRIFIDAVRYFLKAVSWGGHESLMFPMMAVWDLPGKSQPSLPVNFIRLYVGLEDSAVLIQDLETALDKI